MKLIIANKNYSSWSLRGWLALKAFDVPFEEVVLPLFTDQFYSTLATYTPVKKVPVLVDNGISVWDSLAIAEYVNETYLDGKAWPSDAKQRATARSVVAQMHSGYHALRNEMPMNCRAKRRVTLSEAAQKDVQDILSLWQQLRSEHQAQGHYLFGAFSLADAFFAPVVFRFASYGVELTDLASEYQQTMLTHPDMAAWFKASQEEPDIVDEGEVGEPV